MAFGKVVVVMLTAPPTNVATTADQGTLELRENVPVYDPAFVTTRDSVAAGDLPVSL